MSDGIAYVEFDTGQVIVEMPYDRELIDEIKEAFDWPDRAWDGKRKAWTFVPPVWDEARRLIEKYFTVMD